MSLETDYQQMVANSICAQDGNVVARPHGDVKEMERRGWLTFKDKLAVLGHWERVTTLLRNDPGYVVSSLFSQLGQARDTAEEALRGWHIENALQKRQYLESWVQFSPFVLRESFTRLFQIQDWRKKGNKYFLAICRSVGDTHKGADSSWEDTVEEDRKRVLTRLQGTDSFPGANQSWDSMEDKLFGEGR